MGRQFSRYGLALAQLTGASVSLTLVVGSGLSLVAVTVALVTFGVVALNVRLFGGLNDDFIRRLVSSCWESRR